MPRRRTRPSEGVYVYSRKRGHLDRWVVEYRPGRGLDGKQQPKEFRIFETRPEAEAYAVKKRELVTALAANPQTGLTVEQAWEQYRKWAAARLRPGTLTTYEDGMRKHILPALGQVPVAELTSQRVRALIEDMLGANMHPKSVRNFVGILRSVLALLITDGKLATNPASIKRNWIPTRQADPEVLTRSELKTFLAAAKDEPYYPHILFLALTGARLGEMAALQWGDVDLEGRTAMIRRSVRLARESEPKTRFGLRKIDLPPTLADVMKKLPSRHLALVDPKALVFPQASGGYINARHLHYVVRRTCRRAGVRPIHPHSLRHTWATLMLNQDAPLNYVSRALGHHSPAFTATVYARHYDPHRRQEDVDKLARSLEAPTENEG